MNLQEECSSITNQPITMCDTQKEWCEVGEHYVDPDEMWPCFADCKNCVSEKDYKEAMGEDEEDEEDEQ